MKHLKRNSLPFNCIIALFKHHIRRRKDSKLRFINFSFQVQTAIASSGIVLIRIIKLVNTFRREENSMKLSELF